jgi:peptide deformylase
MAIRKVARMGHPVLRQKAEPVPEDRVTSPEVQAIIDDLLVTMVEYDGAGLAAPQIHEPVRIVIAVLDEEMGPQIWVNPVITPLGDEMISSYEGCLSVPGLRGAVARHAEIDVRALDRAGKKLHLHLRGFPAVVAQHECDHLDGILYVDKADPETLTFLEEYRRFGPWPLEETEGDVEGTESEEVLAEGGQSEEPSEELPARAPSARPRKTADRTDRS